MAEVMVGNLQCGNLLCQVPSPRDEIIYVAFHLKAQSEARNLISDNFMFYEYF